MKPRVIRWADLRPNNGYQLRDEFWMMAAELGCPVEEVVLVCDPTTREFVHAADAPAVIAQWIEDLAA